MQQTNLKHLITVAAIALCISAALPAAAQKALLDVQANVSPEDILYFEGTVTPTKLTPAGQLQVRNEVDVLVEYVEKGGKFRTLPNRVIPTSNESYRGKKLLEGAKLEGRDSTLVEICGQELLEEDEGQPFVVTGTVNMSGARKFRIITRLRHQWAGTFPEVECFYDISGPYAVKAGIARERESKDLLSQAGRFLEHSVCEIGEGVATVGGYAANVLLAGGTNPVAVLQALLLGQVQEQSGALGEALRFIGGAMGAGASTVNTEQVLSSGTDHDDLTTSLVRGLVARYGGDLTGGGVAGAGAAGEFDVDDLIDEAISRLEEDLGGNLGLRNVRIDLDGDTAVVASEMPSLDGHGHLEPIIAYMLVDAALAAPWTDAVAAVFDSGGGSGFGISAPAEAARNLARGQIDVQTFLQLCRFADPDSPIFTSGGITGNAGIPGSQSAEEVSALLPQSRLPTGWLASNTHPVNIADLDAVIPGLELSAQSISWGGIQVVQTETQPVTVVALEMPAANAALQLVQLMHNATSGRWDDNLLHLATDPPLHALQAGTKTYLLQGDRESVSQVAQLLVAEPVVPGATRAAGLTDLLPGGSTSAASATAQPAPAPPATPEAPEPPEPEDASGEAPTPAPAPVVPGLPGAASAPDVEEETPEPLKLAKSGYLRKAYLCTVGGDDPVELEGPLAAGTERLGVYLEIKDAPRGSVIEMDLVREGFSQGRRMMGVNGDRRTVAYFTPSGGFTPGRYWLEISADDTLVSRILFEVK